MSLPKLVWKPSPNIRRGRNGQQVQHVCLHSTEGAGTNQGYEGSVAWLCDPQAQVSAHFVVPADGHEVSQLVDLADTAWAVCKFNGISVSIELAGIEKNGLPPLEWNLAADVTAYLLHHLGLPVRYARGGVGPGFLRHLDYGPAGGGHTDPTQDEGVWAAFCAKVAASYAKGDFPAVWEHDGLPQPSCKLAAPAIAPKPAMPAANPGFVPASVAGAAAVAAALAPSGSQATPAVEIAWPLGGPVGISAALDELGIAPRGGIVPSVLAQRIKTFQRQAGNLADDGICGPLTRAALWNHLAHLHAA